MIKKDSEHQKRKSKSNQEPQEQTMISEVLLYGVLNCENLTIEEIISNQLKVGVLQHYDRGTVVVNNGDNQFYEMWAYPDGIKIYDTRLRVINDSQPEHSFGEHHNISLYSTELLQSGVNQKPNDFIYSFVHTDYSLNRTYFTALCWHEKKYCPLNRQKLNGLNNKNIYKRRLPKCTLWQLQNDPLMIDFSKQLVYIPKVLIVGSKYPLFLYQRELLRFYFRNVIAQTNDLLISRSQLNHFKQLYILIGYPQAQVYFDQEHPQIGRKHEKYKDIEKTDLQQFYTSFLFLAKFSKNVNHLELSDCWNSSIKFTPILFNRNLCFSKPNINLTAVIKKIGVKKLITLWKCMILERHILIFSMNNLQLVELCETLLYLIEPIRWENIYIPFLPFHLVNNIDAIQSYLIGMSRIHMDYVIEHFSMNDIVLMDLDQNLIIQNGGKNQVQLPPKIYNMMYSKLAALGYKKDNLFTALFRENDQHIQNQEQKVFKIKQIFFDALLFLLNNYRQFAKLNQDNLLVFDRQGYQNMFTEEPWKNFAKQLVNTMIFVRLCEYHLYEEKILKWNQSNIGGLFVYCQNILAEKGQNGSFWQMPRSEKIIWDKTDVPYYQYFNFVLKNDLQKLRDDKRIYSIQHYLIKYLSYIQLNREYLNIAPQNKPKRNSFAHLIIDFLFPWVSEIEEQCSKQEWNVNRNSLRLSLMDLPDLQCLFGGMKRSGENLNKANIENMLKENRIKKSNYINYKLLGHSLDSKERISV